MAVDDGWSIKGFIDASKNIYLLSRTDITLSLLLIRIITPI